MLQFIHDDEMTLKNIIGYIVPVLRDFDASFNVTQTGESLATPWCSYDVNVIMCIVVCLFACFLVCDLNRTPIVMAKHGRPCVHFSGISTCGRTSRETASHPQHPPLPTLCKISLPVYVIVTNERLQPLTTTWYNSLLIYFSVLNI